MDGAELRILLVDENRMRADHVVQALRAIGYAQISQAEPGQPLERCVRKWTPDLILIDVDSPSRDVIEQVAMVQGQAPRPIVMFTMDDDKKRIAEAIHAGVSAYVVDGLNVTRVRPIIDVAMARFKEFESLRNQRDKARADLANRKTIERAKGVIMRQRKCDESEAYRLMQKLAMDQKRRLISVAEQLLMADELFRGSTGAGDAAPDANPAPTPSAKAPTSEPPPPQSPAKAVATSKSTHPQDGGRP